MNTKLEQTDGQWGMLTSALERFIEQWEHGDVPQIHLFLDVFRGGPYVVAACELIKVDIEYRLRKQCEKSLESYFLEFPQLLDGDQPPCDLIFEEFQLRKQIGLQPDLDDYCARFPTLAGTLRRLVQCAGIPSSSLAHQLPPRDFRVGEQIDEFVLLNQVGSGSFARVFLARQTSMQRMVALKITTQRTNEPETLAQLEHPSIIRVYDQRFCQREKLWLLYMQFAPGGTLRELVDRVASAKPELRTGKLLLDSVDAALERAGYPPIESDSLRRRLSMASWTETVCRIGVHLAMALDYAHGRGVLHRDIKPANVLLTAECLPKLADFNVSFASKLDGISATAFFGGSLAYMSPEQLEAFNPELESRAEDLDGRSDLFSLAALLWELLFGQRPFRDDAATHHRNRILRELVNERRHRTPQVTDPNVDSATRRMAEVLIKALNPTRENRPATGIEFATQIWLCQAPKALALLHATDRNWPNLAARFPMFFAMAVALLPNGFAGWLNYLYNHSQVTTYAPASLASFEWIAFVLNVFYFSLGAGLAYHFVGPVATTIRLTQGSHQDASAIRQARNESLRLGSLGSYIGIGLWLSSGILFPLSLQLFAPEIQLNLYIHFLASMTVCGLIAAAYPFFCLTFLVVHVFYPRLIRCAPGNDEDELALKALEGRLSWPLFVAAIVPLASLLMVAVLGIETPLVSLTLIVSGLLGLVMAYLLYTRIRDDVAVLHTIVRGVTRQTDFSA